ncbi:hypothetical protein H5410_027182 [Solanum commersonii]|uniref:DUF1985 domain-containing protein n=1 Tax=Solanum commersonii TaxID=4109 RepID=A0A9J5YZ53_SOLCO|nr:hypothetical protein H5410_027182 [Solanum commersonii]
MVEIDNYEDSSAQATVDVESSEENTNRGDEESSKDSRDTEDEDDDPLSLPTVQELNKEQKLKCSLVWLVHSMLLAHDRSKIVDSNHIKMVDDLDFFKSYPWGKECFDLTVKYLKNKINLKKQSEVYKERGNASYALYGFPWAFLIWIYEVFPHLGNYAKKSLDSPLSILHLRSCHTAKSDNIVEGDPFEYKGKSTKVNLKGVTILTFAIENEEDEILEVNEDYTTPTVDEDGAAIDVDEILPLAIVDEDLVAVDEYFAEEVNEQEEEKMEEKDEEREEEKLEENEEEIEEKLEEKKQEEKEEEQIEENKEEEKTEEQIEEKEQEQKEEEKIEENKE